MATPNLAAIAIAAPQLLGMSWLKEVGQGQALFNASFFDWTAVLVPALGGFVASYAIWYGLLRNYRLDQVAPFSLLMPIIGVVTGFLLLNERPPPLVQVGGLVILIGLGLVVRGPKKSTSQTA